MKTVSNGVVLAMLPYHQLNLNTNCGGQHIWALENNLVDTMVALDFSRNLDWLKMKYVRNRFMETVTKKKDVFDSQLVYENGEFRSRDGRWKTVATTTLE